MRDLSNLTTRDVIAFYMTCNHDDDIDACEAYFARQEEALQEVCLHLRIAYVFRLDNAPVTSRAFDALHAIERDRPSMRRHARRAINFLEAL